MPKAARHTPRGHHLGPLGRNFENAKTLFWISELPVQFVQGIYFFF